GKLSAANEGLSHETKMVKGLPIRKVKVATAANFIFHLHQGARKGAPQAQQVADRFHLLLNLREALKRLFERKHEVLQEEAGQQHEFLKSSEDVETPDEAVAVPAPLTPTAIQKQARRARRLSRYEEVMRLHEQGASQVTIAALMGLHRD